MPVWARSYKRAATLAVPETMSTSLSPVHTSDANETPAVDGTHFHADESRTGLSVHTPACAADELTSILRALVIVQSQASIHGPISALSRPRYVIRGRSRLQQIIMAEMDAPFCSKGPTRHRISSRIYGGHADISAIILSVPKFCAKLCLHSLLNAVFV